MSTDDHGRAAEYWNDIAARLRLEPAGDDGPRRWGGRLALFCVLAEYLDREAEAAEVLGGLLEEPDDDLAAILAWEDLRFSTRRDFRSRARALERLAGRIEDPGPRAAAFLFLSRLQSVHLSDPEGAETGLAAALDLDPDNRPALWMRLLAELESRGDGAAVPSIDRLRFLTADPVLRAALTVEEAAIRRRQGEGADETATLHEEVLALDVADWGLLNDVARECAAIGRHDLSIRAWERIARGAAEPPAEPAAGRPAGHSFDGIRRGAEAAGVAWWMSGLLRERRFHDAPGALVAAENAFDNLPDSDFLRAEVARLRRLAGADGEALAAELALPGLLPVEICLLALGGGLGDRVRNIVRALPPAHRTPVMEALLSAAGTGDDQYPDDDDGDPGSWLAANPDHADARSVASRLLASDRECPVARLVTEEGPGDDPWWARPEGAGEPPGWDRAIRALETAIDGRVGEGLRALAETMRTAEVRAPLLAGAALAAEGAGQRELALELALATAAIAPEDSRATELVLRNLRRARKHEELAERLGEMAAATPDPRKANEAQLERSLLLEYALDRPAEAGYATWDLAAAEPANATAVFAALRVALRLADWDRALEFIDRLAELAPADRPRLDLLAGELSLLALGRNHEAAERFARAEGGLPEPLATAARLYGVHAAHDRGDQEEVERLLRAVAAGGDSSTWLPEIREAARRSRGAAAAVAPEDAGSPPDATRLLWSVMGQEADGRGRSAAAASLADLGELIAPGAMAGACRVAAMLLGSNEAAGGMAGGEADSHSDESLWHLTERPWLPADQKARAVLAGRRAEGSTDPHIRADWLLARAEALEEAAEPGAALAAIREGEQLLPEHPGLLEARARLALAAGEFTAAADARERLARVYVAEEEQAAQLAGAAVILLDRLEDAAAAERVLREALRLVPGHAESNELLERLLRDRDDDDGLAEQLKARIAAEYDSKALIDLYQEQADQLLAMEDMQGALDAIDDLLLLDRENAPAHRMKIDLLSVEGRWAEVVESLGDLVAVTTDAAERRTGIWRAAEIRATEIDDLDGALGTLDELWASGDEHPQTMRLKAQLAEEGGRFEDAADALEALSARLNEPIKRAGVLRERARLMLEHLFDDEGAAVLLDEALKTDPTDIEALKLSMQSREEDDDEARAMLERADEGLQARIDDNPLDPEVISRLRALAEIRDLDVMVRACGDASTIIRGGETEPLPGVDPPRPAADPDGLRALLLHPDERGSPASRVALAAATVAGEVFAAAEGFPAVPREGFVPDPGSDPAADWAGGWAAAIGSPLAVARHGEDPRGSVTLPGVMPTVVINRDLAWPLDHQARFFLARHVWRAAAGLGSFHEGDAATPIRWLMALAAVCLGDKAPLPLPTDRVLVERARKAMPRKLRKSLTEHCRELVAMAPAELRLWVAATSNSADRLGLLASGDLGGAVRWIVEESAGPNGLRQLEKSPTATLARIPRGRQVIRFALSPDWPAVLAATGGGRAGGAP